jgi:hypothetical protein
LPPPYPFMSGDPRGSAGFSQDITGSVRKTPKSVVRRSARN